MKTQLIFCIPLYLFCAGCLLTLLYYFIPIFIAIIKAINWRKVISISLAGYLVISVIYIVIVSFI
jgi:hypothetical protein